MAAMLETAELIWQAFRDHFQKSGDAPMTLRELAGLIGKPLDHVTLVHQYMCEWWDTPRSFTVADTLYQTVTVSEKVFDHDSFASCIEEIRQTRSRSQEFSQGDFVNPLVQDDRTPRGLTPHPLVFTEPSWFDKLPPSAQALVRETHAARRLGLLALSAMGIRAVIDVVADHLLGSNGFGFGKKLAELQKAGHLSAQQHEAIIAVVEVGHAAAHRAHIPGERDVQLMWEILEHILCSAYSLTSMPTELNLHTPPKPRAKKISSDS